ncbi:GNAT family N-acetyltransferase [Mesobacillus harenae]|uniref:GNAT family N-acetyltransferase n=1 Tax=Mesobacillus harenae TaxID=2213203 RepID=UPI001580D9ED|nr:GNAT family protein [Mesobacillus harenae]
MRLEGKSVILIPMNMDHLEDLWNAANSSAIWTFMATKIGSKDELAVSMHTAILEADKGLQMPFTVIHKDTKEVIGSTRFIDISLTNKSLEIGWTWYNPAVWRTKVNTECKYLLFELAFESMGIRRIQLKTDLRNTRSQQAIERLGALREGVMRKDRVLSDGYVRNTVLYSVLDEEWPAVKQNLLKKLNT